ncbi:hypothetical protein APHAL10511_004463 [Amanita phalloides]|nr:hypothetical protein APHAL10511_004463 [Amanita phalloides]
MSDGSKAIGSLAKKQSEVTRQGTQKLKFVPTLPVRRRKEEAKPELSASSSLAPVNADVPNDGRGSGRRGIPRQIAEMTASGPFAMGPALSGSGSAQSRSRLDIAPPAGPSGASRIASSAQTPLPNKDVDLTLQTHAADEDDDIYSEPDDGVEIIDLQKVRELDWMAPETLRKEQRQNKRIVKEEKEKGVGATNPIDPVEEFDETVENFTQANLHQDLSNHGQNFLFFQFPTPFPVFLPNSGSGMQNAADPLSPLSTKDAAPTQSIESTNLATHSTTSPELSNDVQAHDTVDGVIGQLEVYRSGAIKFRFTNGILLDVNAAIQPSFLQQAIYLHRRDKRMVVIGDVNKRFVVSPNVDTLLTMMREADSASAHLMDEEKLIQMDVS